MCKLVKSLYGLKQAPKQWHQKFDSAILSNGFVNNNVDKCLYVKICNDFIVIICLYVDDMLILSNIIKCVLEKKRFMSFTFKMKNLRQVDTILRIKVKQNKKVFALCQSHYIEKVLKKFSHLNVKEANTSFYPSIKFISKCERVVAQIEYASVIGSLMYVVQCTRPDITFTISKLNRFTCKLNI